MRQAFAEYAGALPVESGALSETVQDVEAAMARPDAGAVLAFAGEVAVASARYLAEDDALYVGRVSVLPAYRRRGVASAVMAYLEEVARSLGRAAIRIGVRESLPSNIALYQRLGYETLRIEPHPRGADRSWTMRKQLSGR
jgi:ribosomal protein S18 acetylase RimI-like enzyme